MFDKMVEIMNLKEVKNSPSKLRVLIYCVACTRKTKGYLTESISEVSKETGVTRKTVGKLLKLLEENGYVFKIGTSGYVFNEEKTETNQVLTNPTLSHQPVVTNEGSNINHSSTPTIKEDSVDKKDVLSNKEEKMLLSKNEEVSDTELFDNIKDSFSENGKEKPKRNDEGSIKKLKINLDRYSID